MATINESNFAKFFKNNLDFLRPKESNSEATRKINNNKFFEENKYIKPKIDDIPFFIKTNKPNKPIFKPIKLSSNTLDKAHTLIKPINPIKLSSNTLDKAHNPNTPQAKFTNTQQKPLNTDSTNSTTAATGVLAATCAFFSTALNKTASGLKIASLYTGSFVGGSMIIGSTIQAIRIIKEEPTRAGMKKALPKIAEIGVGALIIGITQWTGSAAQKRPLAMTAVVGGALNAGVMIGGQISFNRIPAFRQMLLRQDAACKQMNIEKNVCEKPQTEKTINATLIKVE